MSDLLQNIDAQARQQQLRESFLAALGPQLDQLESDLRGCAQASDLSARIDSARRALCALGIATASHGLSLLATISERMEACLADAHPDRSADCVDTCLAHLELMRAARQQAMSGAVVSAELEARLDALRGDRYRALVVETSRVNIKLCQDSLKKFPIDVAVLDDGLEALRNLVQQPYDLLITGLEIKSLNGLALVAAVRANRRLNHAVPVILLSSSSRLPPFKRDLDPNITIARDHQFADNLAKAIRACLARIEKDRTPRRANG